MRDLKFILKRINQLALAKRLKINRSNVTNWLVMNRIPRTQVGNLKKIREELSDVQKR